jgi:hypothetical protein
VFVTIFVMVGIGGASGFDLVREVPGFVAVFGGRVGAMCGAVLAPFVAFTFLRHVPLWRLFAETLAGTVVGGAIGFLTPIGWLVGPALVLVGFFGAGARLGWAARRDAERPRLATG